MWRKPNYLWKEQYSGCSTSQLHADWWWRHEEGWWFNDAKIQTICKAWYNIFLANLCIYLAFCKIIIVTMTSAAMQELRFQHSSANNILTHQIDDRHHGSQDSTDMPPCKSVEPACSQSLYKAKQLGHWKRVFEAGACWFRTCKPRTHILQFTPEFQTLLCLWATRSLSQLRNVIYLEIENQQLSCCCLSWKLPNVKLMICVLYVKNTEWTQILYLIMPAN